MQISYLSRIVLDSKQFYRKASWFARSIFHAVVDSVDMSFCVLVTGIVMWREFWLYFPGFPREVQNTTEGLPFEKTHLFNQKTDDSLHSLKDSHFMILGHIYMGTKEKMLLPITSPML